MFFEKKAFTLIELVVIMAIISLLMGVTIAIYTDYSQTVKLDAATKNFVDSLYLARKKARAADVSRCDTGIGGEQGSVSSYQVEKVDSIEYQIIPVCSVGTPLPIVRRLDNGVIFKSFPNPVEFKILTSFSPTAPSVCIILSLNDKRCRYAHATADGVISSGKLANCSLSCP